MPPASDLERPALNVPVVFLLGFVTLLLAQSADLVLPGSGDVGRALLAAPALLVPALLVALAGWRLHRDVRFVARDRSAVLLLQLAGAAVPLAYLAMLVPGTWLDLADAWAGGHFVATFVLLLAPLLLAEGMRIRGLAHALRRPGEPEAAVAGDVRSRFAILGVFTLPWLLLAVAGDLLRPHRELFVFCAGTTVGLTLGIIAFVLVLGLVLPLLFRVLFGLSTRLPEPLGTELRATAATLGFPGRSVLWLDSGLRAVNALLLGPLPWPRYLVVTDGLVTALDVHALRGVVAHEVGHAQAGHPALLLALFVVSPVLLTSALPLVDLAAVDAAVQALAFVLLVGAGAWLLRRVAHRFEHEADVLSAIALGGAEPCIRALQRVGQVIQQEPRRASLLHPSEADRVRLLEAFAVDPRFRARFTLRGLRLRRTIAAVLGLAVLVAAWSWLQVWPLEKAVLRYHVGDLAGAREQVAAVGDDVGAHQSAWWGRFQEDLEAASAVAGDGGAWEELRAQFAAEGWRRGVEVLLRDGPALARRWFALAAEDPARSPLRASLLRYCEAASAEDREGMLVLEAHLRRLGIPPELTPYFDG